MANHKEIQLQLRLGYTKIIAVVIVVAVIPSFLVTWLTGKQGALNLRNSQVAACERAILDRRVNLQGWTTAAQARRLAAQNATTQAERELNQQAEQQYQLIVQSLRSRAFINCQQEIPKP